MSDQSQRPAPPVPVHLPRADGPDTARARSSAAVNSRLSRAGAVREAARLAPSRRLPPNLPESALIITNFVAAVLLFAQFVDPALAARCRCWPARYRVQLALIGGRRTPSRFPAPVRAGRACSTRAADHGLVCT